MLITLTPGDTATQIEEGGSSHTEQSATQSKVSHHTRGGGHLLNLWGPPLESVGLPPVSTLIAKCQMEKSITPHTWWGPPLESVSCGYFPLLSVPPGVSVISILSAY